jgi:hypothetical protein
MSQSSLFQSVFFNFLHILQTPLVFSRSLNQAEGRELEAHSFCVQASQFPILSYFVQVLNTTGRDQDQVWVFCEFTLSSDLDHGHSDGS